MELASVSRGINRGRFYILRLFASITQPGQTWHITAADARAYVNEDEQDDDRSAQQSRVLLYLGPRKT